MLTGIIYNEFGQIAQTAQTTDIFELYEWFKTNGVVDWEWSNKIVESGDLYYYHRPQV
jgi:hypothetical protein